MEHTQFLQLSSCEYALMIWVLGSDPESPKKRADGLCSESFWLFFFWDDFWNGADEVFELEFSRESHSLVLSFKDWFDYGIWKFESAKIVPEIWVDPESRFLKVINLQASFTSTNAQHVLHTAPSAYC